MPEGRKTLLKPPSDETLPPVLKPADNGEENASKSNLTDAANKMFGERSPMKVEDVEHTPERSIDGTFIKYYFIIMVI